MKNNFKVGETVLVYKKIADTLVTWPPPMDIFINKTICIRNIIENYALGYNYNISKEEFYFPLESLRKLRKEKFKRLLNENEL